MRLIRVSPQKWFCKFVAWPWHACSCSSGGSPWRCSLSHSINEIDQENITSVTPRKTISGGPVNIIKKLTGSLGDSFSVGSCVGPGSVAPFAE